MISVKFGRVRISTVIGLVVGICLALAAQVQAGPKKPKAKQSIVNMLIAGTSTPVDGASTLLRTKKEVWLTIHTTGLDANSVYTIWWAIFNHPDECTGPCDGNDFDNPKVDVTVMWAAALITDSEGVGNVTAHLAKGDPPAGVFIGAGTGNGLKKPMDAQIHAIVRFHGPPLTGMVDLQISTTGGGCDVVVCENQQVAIHLP